MVNLVIAEALKLKRTFILWVGVLVMSVVPFLTLAINADRTVTFLEFAKSSLVMSILLSFPCTYALVATFIFNREYQEDTMKMLLCVPVSRCKIIMSKLLMLVIFFALSLTYHAVLTIIFAVFLNCSDISVVNAISIIFTNLWVILPYTIAMLPIIGFIVFSRKGYILPLGISIAITISNMIITQSKFAAFYPWAAVVRFCGDIQGTINFNFQYPVFSSAVALTICALVGIAILVLSVSRQEF